MRVEWVAFKDGQPFRGGVRMGFSEASDNVSLDAKDAFLVVRDLGKPEEGALLVPYGAIKTLRAYP